MATRQVGPERLRLFSDGVFGTAADIAVWWPVVAMALICLCLIGYLRPDIPPPKDAEP
jgi:hypothetical protein